MGAERCRPVNILSGIFDWLTSADNWSGAGGIPQRMLEHLTYSVVALALAAVIALPLGLWIGHTGRLAFLVVNLSNAARALPTVGVLILAVALVGIGFTPVLLALVALAVPPILVNTYEGVRSVDPTVPAAAKGMGMRGPQILLRAEVPVALPAILLGLRTAAVQTISTATIAALVSLGGLGRFVFDGLARSEYDQVAGGAVLVAALAIAAEGLFTLLMITLVSPGVRRRST
jgi:osmoprotectant transport system permease protein